VDLLVKAPLAPGLAQVQVEPNVASAEIHLVPDAQALHWPFQRHRLLRCCGWMFQVWAGDAADPKEKLAPLPPYLTDITDKEWLAIRARLRLPAGNEHRGQHTINGAQFSETDRKKWVEVKKLNTVEEWTIVNNTAFQPIDTVPHHINPFQITEVFDPNQVITPPGSDPVYKYVFDATAKLLPASVTSITE